MAFQLFQHVPSAGNICVVDRTEFSPGPLPGSAWRFLPLPYTQASLFGWSAVPLSVLGLVHCAISSALHRRNETASGDESAFDLIAAFLLLQGVFSFIIFLSYLTTQADWFVFFYF